MLTTISKAVYTYLWLSRVATCIRAHGCSPVVHSGCQNYRFRRSGSRENGRMSFRLPLQSAWYLRTRRIALASWKTVENSTYPVVRYVRFANHSLSHTFNQHLAERLPRPSAKGLYLASTQESILSVDTTLAWVYMALAKARVVPEAVTVYSVQPMTFSETIPT